MALPADVALAVGTQVNLHNLRRAFGVLAVTLAAELAGLRFRGCARQRIVLVHLLHFMAGGAGQRGVLRKCLGPGNLAVTRAAFLRCVRGHRRVRVVTVDARPPRVMGNGINLRETGWPGRVICMAKRTKRALARGRRNVIGGRIHVSRLSAVANLARHGPVAGLVVHLDNVRMAQGTGFVSCITHWLGGVRTYGRRPVVAQVAKRLRDKVVTRADQDAAQDHEDYDQTLYLLRHAIRLRFRRPPLLFHNPGWPGPSRTEAFNAVTVDTTHANCKERIQNCSVMLVTSRGCCSSHPCQE